MHFYIGPTDAGKGATGKFHDAIPEEMSNSSKARNHFSEIGVRNRLRRITRKLFPPPPLLPPPSPPCGRRSLSLLLRNRLLPSPEEHSKEGGREGGTLCRSPFTPARLAATPLGREPTLPPSCSYFPKESAMNLKVNNFFERSERSERSGSIGRTEEECERRRREKKREADRGGTARRPGG